MAKIKTSALVADIKGTVGGNVFASNKGGNYVRRYKKPTNANTVKQQSVRSLFGSMAGQWRSLTQAQRESWIQGAVNFPYQDSLGETRIYSGQQLFNKLNNNLIQIGVGTLVTCPLPQSFPALVITAIDNTVTENLLRLSALFDASTDVPAGFTLVVQATTSVSPGISSPQAGLFKKIQIVEESTDVDQLSIVSSYNAEFGALVLNDTIFVQVFLVNTVSGESSARSFVKSVRIA